MKKWLIHLIQMALARTVKVGCFSAVTMLAWLLGDGMAAYLEMACGQLSIKEPALEMDARGGTSFCRRLVPIGDNEWKELRVNHKWTNKAMNIRSLLSSWILVVETMNS